MHDSPGGWWKAEIVARSIVEEGRPIVWTDDDLSVADIAQLERTKVRSCAVRSATAEGLSSAHLQQVMAFLMCVKFRAPTDSIH